MTDTTVIIRTPEEEIAEIDSDIARIDEILAGQIEPVLTLPEGIDDMPTEHRGELENKLNTSYVNSHKIWSAQQVEWNAKRDALLERKSELTSE